MDLNHIELPPIVVADLYFSSLIADPEKTTRKGAETGITDEEKPSQTEKSPVIIWKSLGSNQKNILIIVNTSEAVHLPDHELTFLTGILGACKLSLADVAIVNLHNQPQSSFKELTSFFKSKIVFLFDMEPAVFGLPMHFPQYQIQAFAGNSFLYAPSLKELENDRVEKSKLWVCLKRLFNL
jgi:hypothetical protein